MLRQVCWSYPWRNAKLDVLLPFMVLVSGLLGGLGACAPHRQDAVNFDARDTDSPLGTLKPGRLSQVEEEWQSRCSALSSPKNSKDRHQQEYGVMASLLRERLTRVEIEELVESFSSLSPEQWGRREHRLLRATFHVCLHSGQRRTIVRLLSIASPAVEGGVEWELVWHGRVLFVDPIQILADAFEASRSAAARFEIATAFERAFPQLAATLAKEEGLERKSKDDGFFGDSDSPLLDERSMDRARERLVRRCLAWYEDHKAQLRLNEDYKGLGRVPLFLLRK